MPQLDALFISLSSTAASSVSRPESTPFPPVFFDFILRFKPIRVGLGNLAFSDFPSIAAAPSSHISSFFFIPAFFSGISLEP